MLIKKYIFFGPAFIYIGDIRPYDLRHKVENGKFIKNLVPRIVFGDFDCSALKLKTLENCPIKIFGRFICQYNFITSLFFFPKKITMSINISNNKLTSLKGMLSYVKGACFDCSNNKLYSLEGGPTEVKGDYNCSFNILTSLKGSPKLLINGEFNCSYNLLTDLKNSPLCVSYLNCCHNKLLNLDYCPKVLENIFYIGNLSNLNIEALFIEYNGSKNAYCGYNYYQELHNFIFKYKLNILDVNWPDEVINTDLFDIQEKNLLKSNKIASKFNL